jgi:hypothetical protein
VITAPDEYPIHQIPEPIAFSGTDRNFYDRYFFNGFNPDGSELFAVAFGVYPQWCPALYSSSGRSLMPYSTFS